MQTEFNGMVPSSQPNFEGHKAFLSRFPSNLHDVFVEMGIPTTANNFDAAYELIVPMTSEDSNLDSGSDIDSGSDLDIPPFDAAANLDIIENVVNALVAEGYLTGDGRSNVNMAKYDEEVAYYDRIELAVVSALKRDEFIARRLPQDATDDDVLNEAVAVYGELLQYQLRSNQGQDFYMLIAQHEDSAVTNFQLAVSAHSSGQAHTIC